jgi:hypothetical protein
MVMAISLLCLVAFLGCEKEENPTEVIQGFELEPTEAGKLNAFPILGYMQDNAYLSPEVDGSNTDLIWDSAEPYTVQLAPDENGFAPEVTFRALYDSWFIYFLIEWEDETRDISPNFWWRGNSDPSKTTNVTVQDTIYTVWVTADSSYRPQRRPVKREEPNVAWRRWGTPFDAVIKTTTFQYQVTVSVDSVFTTIWDSSFVSYDTLKISGGEDGLALMWNVNAANFLKCSNLCHGNTSVSTDLNESADVWSWYSYRTNFKKVCDDLSLSNLGFAGDIGDSCFIDNIDGSLPDYAFVDQPLRNADAIYDTTSVNYYGTLAWFSGNYIPGYVLKTPSDDRADIRAVATHDGKKWELEMKRKLQTRDIKTTIDDSDIQFNPDSNADVAFHLVLYNNSRGKNHALTTSAHILHFVQLKK